MMYPPVVPFFVIPILYPLNILLFGAVPTGEGFVKWKVWCYFQSQSFDLNKSLAQVLLVVSGVPIVVYNRSLIENAKR